MAGGNLLSVLGNNLKSDYDVVLAAVKKQGCQLQHADISIQGNINIALAALHSCSETIHTFHTLLFSIKYFLAKEKLRSVKAVAYLLNEMNIEDNDKKYQLETDLFGVVETKGRCNSI